MSEKSASELSLNSQKTEESEETDIINADVENRIINTRRAGTITADEIFCTTRIEEFALLRIEADGEYDLEIPKSESNHKEYDVDEGTRFFVYELPTKNELPNPPENSPMNPNTLKTVETTRKDLNSKIMESNEKVLSLVVLLYLYANLKTMLADKNFPDLKIDDPDLLKIFPNKRSLKPVINELAHNVREYTHTYVNVSNELKGFFKRVISFFKEWKRSSICDLKLSCSRLYEESISCQKEFDSYKKTIRKLYRKVRTTNIAIAAMIPDQEGEQDDCKEKIAIFTRQHKEGEKEIKLLNDTLKKAEKKLNKAKNKEALEKESNNIFLNFVISLFYGKTYLEERLANRIQKAEQETLLIEKDFNEVKHEVTHKKIDIVKNTPSKEDISVLIEKSKNIKNFTLPQLDLISNQFECMLRACEKYELYLGLISEMIKSLNYLINGFIDDQNNQNNKKSVLKMTPTILEIVETCIALIISVDVHNEMYEKYGEDILSKHYTITQSNINWSKVQKATKEKEKEAKTFIDKRMKENMKKGREEYDKFLEPD